MRHVRPFALVAVFITVWIIGQPGVEATHFRGGTMSVSIDPSGVATVNAETLWEKGGDEFTDFPLGGITRLGQVPTLSGPDFQIDFQLLEANTRTVIASVSGGTLAQPNIVTTTTSVDFSNADFDIRNQQFTVDLSAYGLGYGSYILYWADAGRILGLQNVSSPLYLGASNGPFSLEARFIYDGTQRSTPTITSRVLTTVVQGQDYSNNLNASGNGPLSYSFVLGSTEPRWGPTTPIPGLTVDSAGQLSIPDTATEMLIDFNSAGEQGDYVFKVQITDVDGQYIEQDVMLDVVESPNQLCTIEASELDPTVTVGETLVLDIMAFDPDPGDSLTIRDFPQLDNSTLVEHFPGEEVGVTADATYTFTPDLTQVGTLGVNFEAEDNGDPPLVCGVNVQITVEAPDAEVPVSATGEELPGVASQSKTGSAIAGCGNLFDEPGTGAGLNDVLAGAPGYEAPGSVPVEAGAAVLYFGSSDDEDLGSADVVFTGASAHDRAGVSVACGFSMDLGGALTPVLVVGAEQIDRISDPEVVKGNGRVYVILFDPTDMVHYPNLADPEVSDIVDLALVGQPGGIPGWVLTGEDLGDQAGFCTAGGCALNPGAGPEIIIGAPGADNIVQMVPDTGVVYVLFDLDLAGISPYSGVPIDLGRVANGMADEIAGVRYEDEETGGQLGYACACVGDVVGDSGDDFAMASPFHDVNPRDAGVAFVVPGGDQVSGIIETCEIGTGTTSGTQIQGSQDDETMGTSISQGSLLLGAPLFDPDPSREDAGRVIRATAKLPDGILSASWIGDPDPGNPDSQPGVIYHGASAFDQLGQAVAGLEDVTGDGVPDFAMGAPLTDTGAENAGTAYLVEGTGDTTSRLGVVEASEIGNSRQGRQIHGEQIGEQSGSALASTGNVGGTEEADFAIGAPFKDVFSNADDAGTLYVVTANEDLLVDNLTPIAKAGPDQTVECTGGGSATVMLDGSASTDEDGDPLTFLWSEDGMVLATTETAMVSFSVGVHTVTLRVTDPAGLFAEDVVVITVTDLTAPDIACPAAAVEECQGNLSAFVTLDPATATEVCGSVASIVNNYNSGGADCSDDYPWGLMPTVVRFDATDDRGNVSSCTTDVAVVDTIAPVVTVTASPDQLWPPNHSLIPVHFTVTVVEACDPDPTIELLDIVSSEPDDDPDLADGATSGDIQQADYLTEDYDVLLRAERLGGGPGRTYTVRYRVTDVAGNAGIGTTTVFVPHDLGGSTEPVEVGVKEQAGITEILWSASVPVTGFDVIRGDLAALRASAGQILLGDVECLASDTTVTRIREDLPGDPHPPGGGVWFYLVQYYSTESVSAYGTETASYPRHVESGGCRLRTGN